MTADEIDDRTAIREVLLRYARGVDARDLALVASCFTPDAAYRGALASGTIADALAALPHGHAALRRHAPCHRRPERRDRRRHGAQQRGLHGPALASRRRLPDRRRALSRRAGARAATAGASRGATSRRCGRAAEEHDDG